jgi:hypothetical protein
MVTHILPRDVPHYTMACLEAALEKEDARNARICARALLRSAFNHLYALGFHEDEGDPVIGLAMCELLVLTGDRT